MWVIIAVKNSNAGRNFDKNIKLIGWFNMSFSSIVNFLGNKREKDKEFKEIELNNKKVPLQEYTSNKKRCKINKKKTSINKHYNRITRIIKYYNIK